VYQPKIEVTYCYLSKEWTENSRKMVLALSFFLFSFILKKYYIYDFFKYCFYAVLHKIRP